MKLIKILFKNYDTQTYFSLIFITVLIVFSGVYKGFFQQDEWFIFGSIIGGDFNPTSIYRGLFSPNVGHFNPLTDIITLAEFQVFQLNYTYYASVSILLHAITSVLLFKLANDLFKNSLLAFIASATFALAAGTYQATSWVVVNHATQGATIFGILTFLSLFRFIDSINENLKKRYFICTLGCLIVSLLFKEITIASFILLPLVAKLLFNFKLKDYKIHLLSVLVLGLVYVLLRSTPFILVSGYSGGELLTGTNFKTSVINFILLPINGLAQSLVPVDLLISISKYLSSLLPKNLSGSPGTMENDLFVYKRLLVLVSMATFLLISAWAVYVCNVAKERFRKGIIFGYLFIILNSFVFIASPERSGIMSVIDSRNLYYLSVGSSIIVTGVVGYLSRLRRLYGIILLLAILMVNLYFLSEKIMNLSKVGEVRSDILYDVKSQYPNLPDKTVFYFESDTAYYGLPSTEKIPPFQSGLGQTLLVWYYLDEKYPTQFYTGRFLWEITAEGYKEVDKIGFGYFRDYKKLGQALRLYNLPIESVIAFKWNGKYNLLINTTDEVRSVLKKDVYED